MSTRQHHEENCAGVPLEQKQAAPNEWWNRCTGCGFRFSDRDLDAITLVLLSMEGAR